MVIIDKSMLMIGKAFHAQSTPDLGIPNIIIRIFKGKKVIKLMSVKLCSKKVYIIEIFMHLLFPKRVFVPKDKFPKSRLIRMG